MSNKKDIEDIKVWWVIPEYWYDLTYEQKARYYSEYKYIDGKRVFDTVPDVSGNNVPKTGNERCS